MLRASFLVTSAVALLSLSVLGQNPGFIPPQTISQDPSDWPMYNHDVVGTRCNPAEDELTRDSVRGLKVKWVFPTKGDVYATPSVVNNVVYAGDTSGTFYALTSAGTLLWKTSGSGSIKFGPITASALVTNRAHEVDEINRADRRDGMVVFGDQAGFIYGLKRNTGQLVWSVRPNSNPDAVIFGSPIPVNGQVVIGISSNEGSTKNTFRGSVVSLDPDNGRMNWQTYLITEQEQKSGSSGAGVWSTPTYDADTGLVYVTTGNNYTTPATDTSDAFVALNPKRKGEIQWTHQCVTDDTGTVEADIGDSPQVYALPDGRKVVGAGEKNGIYWVLDAISGGLVGSKKAVLGCVPGQEGLFADSAIANGVVFVNGQDCSVFAKPPFIPPTGVVIALKNTTDSGNLKMEELWRFESPFAPVLSGVAVANGVVYFHNSGILSVLYALDAATGRVLAKVFTNGGISGPSVSNGQIYVGTGTKFASHVPTPTGIVAIGL